MYIYFLGHRITSMSNFNADLPHFCSVAEFYKMLSDLITTKKKKKPYCVNF